MTNYLEELQTQTGLSELEIDELIMCFESQHMTEKQAYHRIIEIVEEINQSIEGV